LRFAAQPARCTCQLQCSMKNSTYSRCSEVGACARRKDRQESPARSPAGPRPPVGGACAPRSPRRRCRSRGAHRRSAGSPTAGSRGRGTAPVRRISPRIGGRAVKAAVVLRHDIAVLRRQAGRPQMRSADRAFLAAASRLIPRTSWRSFFVTPTTLLRWNRPRLRVRAVSLFAGLWATCRA
jgi:hypothetical protein